MARMNAIVSLWRRFNYRRRSKSPLLMRSHPIRGAHLIAALAGCLLAPAFGAALELPLRSAGAVARAPYFLWSAEAVIAAGYLWWLLRSKRSLKAAAAWGIVTVLALLALPRYGVHAVAASRRLVALEQELRGNFPAELAPDNKPSPLLICPIGMGVTIGGNFFGGVEFPFTAVSIQAKPVLILDMTPKGLVASFDVLDDAGNILARVQRNVVDVYARGHIQPKRSLHRLSVTDERGTSVLDMEYLNQNAISIHGKFFIAPHIYLLMDELGTHEIDSRTNQELNAFSRYIGCDVDVGLELQSP
jgi:hypothetical protein